MDSDSKEILNYLKKISDDLIFLKKMYIFQNRSVVNENLELILTDERKILTYDMLDGNTSLSQAAEILRLNQSTLYRWVNEWMKSGIITKERKNGKNYYQKVFSLEESNINKPSLEEYINESNYMFNLPNSVDLHNILSNLNLKYPNELKTLINNVFNMYFTHISDIIITFDKSNTKNKLLFIQGLKQIGEANNDSEFVRYFKRWENNIKHNRW